MKRFALWCLAGVAAVLALVWALLALATSAVRRLVLVVRYGVYFGAVGVAGFALFRLAGLWLR